jgi:hypothetical protein
MHFLVDLALLFSILSAALALPTSPAVPHLGPPNPSVLARGRLEGRDIQIGCTYHPLANADVYCAMLASCSDLSVNAFSWLWECCTGPGPDDGAYVYECNVRALPPMCPDTQRRNTLIP